MKISKLFSLLLLLLLIGCSDTHQLVRFEGSGPTVSKDATAYIVLPKDGIYGSIIYQGSGMTVAQAVEKAFTPYLREIKIASRREPLKTALSSAHTLGFDYVIEPEIVHWEDRNTGWSGRPDVASIKLSIVDVASGMVIDSAELGGTSKVMSWSLEHPEDLLPKPLADYAANLFK
jgi:hypothetical protein